MMKNAKAVSKYTVYAAISVFLFALPFLLGIIFPVLMEDLNPLVLFFPVLPMAILIQGVLSGIVLPKKAKYVYIVASPFVNVAFLLLLDFFTSVEKYTFAVFVEHFMFYFTYPLFILTLMYIIGGWLGMFAVYIFKKISSKTERILKLNR